MIELAFVLSGVHDFWAGFIPYILLGQYKHDVDPHDINLYESSRPFLGFFFMVWWLVILIVGSVPTNNLKVISAVTTPCLVIIL
jgi:hypothetical protein